MKMTRMAAYFAAFLFLVVNSIVFTEGALIAGTTKFHPGQEEVNISCNVGSSTSLVTVYAMTITKGGVPIASVNENGAQLNNGTDLTQRATLQGSVSNASNAYLSLHIPASNTESTDASFYICKLVGATTTDNAYSSNASMTVILKDQPSAVVMTAPTSFEPGKEQVDISCVSGSTPPLKTVYAIAMFKEKTAIAYVNEHGAVLNNGTALTGRASLDGSVSDASNAYLNLTIPASDTKSSDAKPYGCKLVGATDLDGAYSTSVHVNVTFKVTPVSGASRAKDNVWKSCLIGIIMISVMKIYT